MLQYSLTHCFMLQYNLTHCINLHCSSTRTLSCYRTVQHTLYHVTVRFNNTVSCYSTVQHAIIMLHHSSAHTVSCYSIVQHTLYHVTEQFNTHCIMLQYSSAHTVSCYSTVQHTLYHLSVCTVPFPTLYIPICSVPLYHQTVYSLHFLCVSIFTIFVPWYFVCNAWSFAAIISLKVSPFISPLTTHNNMSSPPISCLSTLPMYWLCSNLPSLVFFTVGPNFAFTCWRLPLKISYQLICLILPQTLLPL